MGRLVSNLLPFLLFEKNGSVGGGETTHFIGMVLRQDKVFPYSEDKRQHWSTLLANHRLIHFV